MIRRLPIRMGGRGKSPRSPLWPSVRKRHLRANPRCAACGGIEDVEVHHIYPVSWPGGKDSELLTENLISLCEKRGCHLRFGHLGDYRSRNPEVVADAAAFYQKVRSRPYPPEQLMDFRNMPLLTAEGRSAAGCLVSLLFLAGCLFAAGVFMVGYWLRG